ncbi:MAG: phosphopantothenoylcysteine decarboxylase [Clostridiales Family XIII bacterium]|jgi:phosphopantothenoylcysteine decarboxylase/phosphopantothenoylcysteine decarboxylase/phosphopantothenate--cysteine ligase|nr:phosphopantothenoylcysteine decarboxylase [Clostridiales Family XIII bacterium]
MANILLGICGSIAAYKAADIASRLSKDGHSIDVVMTKNAQEFITPLTFETLTKRKTYIDSFAPIEDFSVEHISLAKRADIVLIAPATANLIGKLASGIADDLLTTVLMAAHAKRTIICPAMNAAMLENPIVQANIAMLKDFGYEFVEPEEGVLACGDSGKGKLASVDEIVVTVNRK